MGNYSYAEMIVAIPYSDAIKKMPGFEEYGDVEEWADNCVPEENRHNWTDVEAICMEYWAEESWIVGVPIAETTSTKIITSSEVNIMAAAAKIWYLFDTKPSLYLVSFTG